MKKNKHNKKRAARGRTKPTTGQREFVNVVYMSREIVDGKVQVYGVCSCNKWRSSKEATTITKVGLEAKAHILASDGKCSFRFHEVPEGMEEATNEDVDEVLAEETGIEIEPS
jgi:hypothetical protein